MKPIDCKRLDKLISAILDLPLKQQFYIAGLLQGWKMPKPTPTTDAKGDAHE